LVACNQSEEMDEMQATREVTFKVSKSALSRAGKETFKEGDAIGIYAVERTSESAVAPPVTNGRANNAKWIKEGNEWKPATAADRITWSQKGTKMDFYAYYPYSEGVTDPAAIALDLGGQSENLESTDYLRAANVTGLSTGEVTLSFDHLLAMLSVTAENLTADEDAIKITGIKTAATLNLGTGEIALSEDEATGVLTMASLGNGLFQGLFPAQACSGEIQCEHNGATYVYAYDFTNAPLEAGKMKKIELTIK